MNSEQIQEVRRYIGGRIKYARSLHGPKTAAQLADAINEYAPDFEYTRGIVANIENGRRGLDVEELCVIASVQGQEVAWYFREAPDSLRAHIPGYRSRRSNPRQRPSRRPRRPSLVNPVDAAVPA